MAAGHLLGWQPRHFIFFDFACRADRTEVQLNDEAEACVWAPVDAFMFPIFFFLLANFLVIPPEEKVLAETLGVQFADYKRRVRRWL